MADINTALAASKDAIEQLMVAGERTATAWTAPRAPGKWSPSQIVEHVARSLEESANMAAGRPSKFPKLPGVVHPVVRGLLFKRVLRKAAFPKAKTNKAMNPALHGTPHAPSRQTDGWPLVSGSMAYDEQLANRIRQAFGAQKHITERRMFGGLAFLYRGRMCCGIVGRDLMVRVPDAEFDAVMRGRHVRPMDFTGKPLRGFAYVSPPGFRTAAVLRTWLSRAERAAEEMAVQRSEPRSRHRMHSTVGGRRTTSQARRSQRG